MNKPTITQISIPSSNYSTNSYKKIGIVMHWMVGTLAGTDAHFKNPSSKVSTQYGIGKDGTIHQYVADNHTAYHAYVEYNRSYFGIEHEGGYLVNGARVKPSKDCHEASIKLVAWLCKTYGIPCDREHIVKHKETGYATECCGTLDIDYIVNEASKLLNQPPMSFNYELYVKSNNLYMRVTSGSIKENITVKNITKGTSWTVFADKSVGNDGNFINQGMESSLYEVVAKGVTRQYDNRPDPCAGVKAELSAANATISDKNKEISSLKAEVGTLTTDRNKWKNLYEEVKPKVDSLEAEKKTLKTELADTKKELETANRATLVCENQLEGVLPGLERLELENSRLEANVQTLKKNVSDYQDALERCRENSKETGLVDMAKQVADLFKKILRWLRSKVARNTG